MTTDDAFTRARDEAFEKFRKDVGAVFSNAHKRGFFSGADFGYAFAQREAGKEMLDRARRDQGMIDRKQKRIAELEEKLSFLAKVPTEPYEKQMAKRILELESALKYIADREWTNAVKDQYKWINEFCDVARKALEKTK